MRLVSEVLLQALLLLQVVLALLTANCDGTSSSASFDSDVGGDDGASSSALVTENLYSLMRGLRDGAAELRSFPTSESANFCPRAPVLVVRAPTANGLCPERWSGLSCSCVLSLQNDTAWTMRISNLGNSLLESPRTAIPATTSSDAISVTSLGTFLVSANLVLL